MCRRLNNKTRVSGGLRSSMRFGLGLGQWVYGLQGLLSVKGVAGSGQWDFVGFGFRVSGLGV